MQTFTSNGSYATWLRARMDEGGFTQRSLARAWNAEDPETARRAIRRYLKGMVPIERTRQELARALGCQDVGPAPDPDKEEDRSHGHVDGSAGRGQGVGGDAPDAGAVVKARREERVT